MKAFVSPVHGEQTHSSPWGDDTDARKQLTSLYTTPHALLTSLAALCGQMCAAHFPLHRKEQVCLNSFKSD